MAYAFDKVSDYFRRQKTGQRGDLQRGTTGAPPPTAAAESLAKQAETSAEIGSSDTSAFRANRGVGQEAAQKALYQPSEKQAQAWGSTQEARAGEYAGGEQKKIEERYQAYNPEDIAKVETGDQGAIQKMGTQRQYTGTEMSWQPYQVPEAQLDTTSMLQGGVGGLQAALQRNKGGRYTGGMAALDASLLASNRGAMQGLQQKLGDIYQGTREKKAALEQTDENLAKAAKERATGIAGTVRGALESRLPQLRDLYAQQVAQGAAQREAESRAGANPLQVMVDALMAQGLTSIQALDALGLGPNAAEFNAKLENPLYMPQASRDIFMQDRDLGKYVVQGPQATYSQAAPTNYASIAAALGVSPETLSAGYTTYGVDAGRIGSRADDIAVTYRNLMRIQGIEGAAPVAQPQNAIYGDRDGDGTLSAEEEAANHGETTFTDTVDLGAARDAQDTSSTSNFQDYGEMYSNDSETAYGGTAGEGEEDGGI